MTISAAGGGSPGSLGSSPGAPQELMIRLGMAITSGPPPPAAPAGSGPSSYLHGQIRHQSSCCAGRRSCRADQVSGSCGNAGANKERNHHQRATFSGPLLVRPSPPVRGSMRRGHAGRNARTASRWTAFRRHTTGQCDGSCRRDRILYVEAIGVESYQWIRNGVAIAGATGPSYTTPALAATDNNASFQVNMTNSFGGSTSPAAVLTVTSTAANSPSSGGGALPAWQLLLLSALLLAARVRVAYREQ